MIALNLKGEFAFPVADALVERGVPFAFATGYDAAFIPPCYQHIPRWEKPSHFDELAGLFGAPQLSLSRSRAPCGFAPDRSKKLSQIAQLNGRQPHAV